MQITTTVDITSRRIADLMVTAIECNDMTRAWCAGIYLEKPDPDTLATDTVWYDDETIYNEPTPLRIRVEVDDGEGTREVRFINMAAIKRAFELMQEFGSPKGWHWRNVVDENFDAETADVFLQLATFGEVIYG